MGSSPTALHYDHRLFSRLHDAKTLLMQTPEKVLGAERGKFWDPIVAVGDVGCLSDRSRDSSYGI